MAAMTAKFGKTVPLCNPRACRYGREDLPCSLATGLTTRTLPSIVPGGAFFYQSVHCLATVRHISFRRGRARDILLVPNDRSGDVFMKEFMWLLFVVVFVGLSFPGQAHAYIDPGIGGMLLQGLAATFIAAMMFFRGFREKLKGFFSKKDSGAKDVTKPADKDGEE